jgi:sterol desaturase/sphingolipid hydroxylase (fatty acid hydroxylase superfamily)
VWNRELQAFCGNRLAARVFPFDKVRKDFQMLGTILIVVLLLLLLGAWPSWPHSRGWGYYPSGTLGLVLVIVLVLALLGRI